MMSPRHANSKNTFQLLLLEQFKRHQPYIYILNIELY